MSTGMRADVETSAMVVGKARDATGGRESSPSPRSSRGEGRGEGTLRDSGQCESPSPRPSPRKNGERETRPLTRDDFAGAMEAKGLYRLMTWMSPSYPVGAFSYSGGIEWAVEAGDIRDADTLRSWLATMIRDGSLFCDAAMFCHAHRASASGDDQALAAVAELAAAFVGSKERFLETTAQGEAFRQITQAAWPAPAMDRLTAAWDGPLAYPIVVAAACAGHGIALIPALQAFLHGVAANLVSAGVRLIPLGQTDGQRVLAALEGGIAQTAARALVTALDDAGAATLRADIAGMRHETQYTRLFRS
jgi:urease accessory protein